MSNIKNIRLDLLAITAVLSFVVVNAIMYYCSVKSVQHGVYTPGYDNRDANADGDPDKGDNCIDVPNPPSFVLGSPSLVCKTTSDCYGSDQSVLADGTPVPVIHRDGETDLVQVICLANRCMMQADSNLNGIGDACEGVWTANHVWFCQPALAGYLVQTVISQGWYSEGIPFWDEQTWDLCPSDGINHPKLIQWLVLDDPDGYDNCPNVPNPPSVVLGGPTLTCMVDDDCYGKGLTLADGTPIPSIPSMGQYEKVVHVTCSKKVGRCMMQADSNLNGMGDACDDLDEILSH